MKKNTKTIVVITGAAGFLGGQLIKKYKELKYKVLGIDSPNNEKKLKILFKNGSLDYYYAADLTSENFISDFESTALSKLKVSILINCVGGSWNAFRGLGRYNDFRQLISTNLFTLWNSCSVFVPMMETNGYGKIINFSSVFAKVPSRSTSYCVAKSSILGFNKHLASYCINKNILVNTISPSHIKNSPRHKAYFKTATGKDFITNKMPLQRLCDTQDINEIILFLTSEKNKSITGQNIIVDGGFSLVSPMGAL